jgi:hypothetical protein
MRTIHKTAITVHENGHASTEDMGRVVYELKWWGNVEARVLTLAEQKDPEISDGFPGKAIGRGG